VSATSSSDARASTRAATDMPPVASVEDLHVSFRVDDGTVHALRGVDLQIAQGEIVALVGESGSGKSVLGSCLLGMPPRSSETTVSGRVEVAGVDMVDDDDRAHRRVRQELLGAVFQDPLSSLNPTMRIGRQLTERGADIERATTALRDAGVPEPERRMKQWPHELSGGLRQRVMIAMALATDGGAEAAGPDAEKNDGPLLIVADEPTTALDVSVQAQIVAMFDRLRREHDCSILLVTHDLGVAAAVADRIAVLYAGRICEIGPTSAVLSNPLHPYTVGLLRSRLSIDGSARPVPIGGSPPDPLHPLRGCGFAPRCASAEADCVEVLPDPMTEQGRTIACFHPSTVPVDLRTNAVASTGMPTPLPKDGERTPRSDPPGRPGQIGHLARPVSALRLEAVSKGFDVGRGSGRNRLHAVSDVTFDVPAGGATVLVGESGCGKTTLLRMATGILTPDSGSVHWPSGGHPPQLVFQDAGASLTPWLTVRRQVVERLTASGVPRAERNDRAMDLLTKVGLDLRAARCRPKELSGGQRQRAAIARALANDPTLLICDEPVSALDASLAVRVLDLLEELRETLGLAILLVTHDLAVARRIGDEVAVMYLGRIVERAPTDEVFDNPQHPYTRGLLDASPTAEPGRLAPTLIGEPPTPFDIGRGCSFLSRCSFSTEQCETERPELIPVTAPQVACHVRPFAAVEV